MNPFTRRQLNIQGYSQYSDEDLEQYKYGIRFAYLGCGLLVAIGLLLQSPAVLMAAMTIAFLAVVLPRHPFDYLYNALVRHLIGKPEVPPRTYQGKFACSIATTWLGLMIYFFLSGNPSVANILGGILLLQAFVVGTVDFCVPSRIFNALFRRTANA